MEDRLISQCRREAGSPDPRSELMVLNVARPNLAVNTDGPVCGASLAQRIADYVGLLGG